jgi:hypothetical protein
VPSFLMLAQIANAAARGVPILDRATSKTQVLTLALVGTPTKGRPVCWHVVRKLDLPNRMWSGPAPLHELATALLLTGYDPWDTNTRELAGRDDLVQHDPVDDAIGLFCAGKN